MSSTKSTKTTTKTKTIGERIHPKMKKTTKTMTKTPTGKKKVSVKKLPANTMFTIIHKFEDSSFIKGFRWVANSKTDFITGNLTVSFKSGDFYLYENFSKEVAMNWRRRKSAGAFFATYVKQMDSKRV